MKDIIFRGKEFEPVRHTPDGWLTGYVCKKDGACYITTVGHYASGKSYFCDVVVDPNTIGQYVGLNDRNGTKIFEGDILESPVRPITQKLGLLVLVTDIRDCKQLALYASQYTVIGNIYDNPELVKEL